MDFAGNASLSRSAALSGELTPPANRVRAKLIVCARNFNLLTAKFLELNIYRRIEVYFISVIPAHAGIQGRSGRAGRDPPYGNKPGFPFARE